MSRFHINNKYAYCPNGNYWEDMSGIFDDRIFLFCDCPKCKGKVYELRPIDVTNKISNEAIEKHRKWNRVEKLRQKITMDNVDDIKISF
jgi:hypothetical protein